MAADRFDRQNMISGVQPMILMEFFKP